MADARDGDGLHADFLPNIGELTALIRAKDWALTPLGPIGTWPQSLRTTVSLCLASNFPINIIWGPQNIQIYNEGYRVVCGDSHPRAMARITASPGPAPGPRSANRLPGRGLARRVSLKTSACS